MFFAKSSTKPALKLTILSTEAVVLLQVLMGDYYSGVNTDDDSVKFVGYCPQTNPLWPDITLQEHFEIYGAIKGMSQADVKEVVKR